MRGSVYRRKGRKTWTCQLDIGYDEDGRRVRKYLHGFRTKKDAEHAQTEALTRLGQGTFIEPSKLTVGVYLKHEWLPAIQSSVRSSTLASYSMNIEHHIIPALGTMKLQKLSPGRLNGFYAELLRTGRSDGRGGLSPKTVRNIHIVIRKALGDAVKWNLLPRNVAEFATPPKLMDSGRKELRTWTADQVRSFLDGVTDDRLYAAWSLTVSTGMRRGEILGLRWEDVDLDALRLSVRQTVITVDYRIEFSTPKTKRSRRSIALDRGMVSALRAHRKRQMEERLAIGYLYSDSGLVFTKVDGKPLHPDYFSQAFDRLVRRSRLPRIRVHDLRHTYATLALAAGIHPKVVSERLGHSTVAFTMDVYSHAVPGMEADAAEKIAALIFGPTR